MSFSEATLSKKFQELNNTQQSVQTLSLWLIHHRKNSNTIVKSWLKELCAANTKADRKLTFIYLANDILQNSRKKGNEYSDEFAKVLSAAIENASKSADSKMRFTLERILNIWIDRKIYSDEAIAQFKKVLYSVEPLDSSDNPESPESKEHVIKSSMSLTPEAPTPSTGGKSRISITKSNTSISIKKEDIENSDDIKKRRLSTNLEAASNANPTNVTDSSSQLTAAAQAALRPPPPNSLREEVAKELAQNGGKVDPPDPVDLISMLQDLEKSASSDAVVREKIAELPQQVSDINSPKNLKDKAEAQLLSGTITDALSLLKGYNSRLQQELANRKHTALLLAVYIRQQQQDAENDQKLIQEWQKKLKQVQIVKQELQIHLQSLPDLSSIEDAAVLTPLPSAGDLFSSH